MGWKDSKRFGLGSLLAAFFGGAVFGQAVLGDEPGEAYSRDATVIEPSPVEVQPLASIPETERNSFQPYEQVPEPVVEPQPFMPAPAALERDVYYPNCAAARAAGAAPVYSDEAGYSRRLDRDGDGVGCE